jgi:hypothetical protein
MKTLKAIARFILSLILLMVTFATVVEVTYEICYEYFSFYRATDKIIALSLSALVTLVTFITIVKCGLSGFFKKAFYLNRSKANPCYMAQPYSVIALGAIWYAVNWMASHVLIAIDWIYYEEPFWPVIIASALVFWLYYPALWGKNSK